MDGKRHAEWVGSWLAEHGLLQVFGQVVVYNQLAFDQTTISARQQCK